MLGKGVPGLSFKLEGDWDKLKGLLTTLSPTLKTLGTYAARNTARKLVTIVKGHLRNQDIPGWQQLATSTIENKGSDDILIDTELYLDSIKAWSEGGTYIAGVPRGLKYPGKKGQEVAKVAYLHEYWSVTGTGPHRPLWNPSIKELQNKHINQIVKNTVIAGLFARGWKGTINMANLKFKFTDPSFGG